MDLLVALGVDGGVFEGVSGAELAALISVLTYEHRSRLDPPPPWFPNQATKQKSEKLMAYGRQLRTEESKRGMPETSTPAPTIFGQVHGWASGHELKDVLDDDTSAGDFVRHIRQVSDLLGQLADCSPSRDQKKPAIEAGRLLDRGLVSAAARVQDGDVDSEALNDD